MLDCRWYGHLYALCDSLLMDIHAIIAAHSFG